MARHVVLLRGVNLAGRNRIAMPALREALERVGFEDVQTYVQSGNVVLTSTAAPKTVAAKVKRAIADAFGFEIEVLVRSRAELAAIVKRNPLGKVAKDPKLYQVTFLAEKLRTSAVRELQEGAAGGEEMRQVGRELYAWHPNGVGRSKLAARLSGKRLGVVATSRNWTTVTALLELADG